MKALKRAVSLLAVALLLSAACLPLAGCDGKKDIVIRLGAEKLLSEAHNVWQDLGTWEFPVGTDACNAELKYTGQKIRIFVEGFRFHEDFHWFEPTDRDFYTKYFFTDENGEQSEVDSISEKGIYQFRCQADSESDLWHVRAIRLYIHVV